MFLSLNGVAIPNDSYVLASDIGVGDSGLHCNTDSSDCCRGRDNPNGGAQGHWSWWEWTWVRSFLDEDHTGSPRNFFSRDRVAGVVHLNRYGTPPTAERGHFRCEIPDASGVNVTLYVNIGEWFVSSWTMWTLTSLYYYSSWCDTHHSATCGYYWSVISTFNYSTFCLYQHHFFWYQHCWGNLQSDVFC